MTCAAHVNSSLQIGILAICAIFIPIAPAAVALRLRARRAVRAKLLWSDHLIMLSCLTQLGMWPPIIMCKPPPAVLVDYLFACGGSAPWPLTERPFSFYVTRVECLVSASSVYILSSYLCRLSILFIYNEFLSLLPRMKTTILAAGAWVLVCGLVSLGVQLGVGIQDVKFVLADLGPDAEEQGMKWTVYGILPDVLSCVCDFLVTAIPLGSLWGLRMRDRRRKTLLIATFMVGFIACGISLVRVFAWKIPSLVGAAPNDPFLERDTFELLYPIETTFGLLGANLPMLRLAARRKEEAPHSSLQTLDVTPIPDDPVRSNTSQKVAEC
ncbi:hypothetical protein GQ53DRAFT_832646 [Thozetella sp. PMI_491]|nr:hypothetical protein GQ53DRAFT_832646 [Thozetella sp. PMI_491]